LTRPLEQSHEWAKLLRQAGAIPVVFPTIVVGPPASWKPLDEALSRVQHYQWLVFTSAAAVKNTLSRVKNREALRGVKVAAVGRHTASVLQHEGLAVDLVPPEGQHQNGPGLARELSSLAPGATILFPQAAGGRPELKNQLTMQGCVVDVVAASETFAIVPLPSVPPFEVATFASPSAFQSFVQSAGADPLFSKVVIALGETTANAVRKIGLSPLVADGPTGESMILAISRAIRA
jgi:uroporphyrinogen-III synthase